MPAPLPHPITAPIPRYHSKTPYSIPLDQEDAIIRASAYHRKDFDRAVIWFSPRTQSNGVTFVSSALSEPTTSLGELDRLPLELINEICLRCCSHCVRSGDPSLCAVTLASVKRVFQLSKTSLAKLPALKTLPGIYTMDERPRSSQITMVPTQSAVSAFSEENCGTRPTPDMIDKLNTQPMLTFMACCALPSYNFRTNQIEHGISCSGCQLALQDGISTGTGDGAGDVRDMVYSRRGFLEHFFSLVGCLIAVKKEAFSG
ncbi:hypothetical protein BDU57DRAFT_593533 [Ampelomyces quisqualis]|uniref:F-box domain-containing protein n=1 Tax=Ampelomyces quisqualis TaxID=50730 RepID=A0A6A5QYX2_AMPQU|nr:hypothetical protein BDU57DRAFT_593533 [Ampelomyces quisqualis]